MLGREKKSDGKKYNDLLAEMMKLRNDKYFIDISEADHGFKFFFEEFFDACLKNPAGLKMIEKDIKHYMKKYPKIMLKIIKVLK